MDREVKVRMSFMAEGNRTPEEEKYQRKLSATIDLMKERKKLQADLDKAGYGGSGPQGGGPLTAALDNAFGTKLGGMIGKMAPPLAAAAMAAHVVKNAFDVLGDATLSQTQVTRKLIEQIPVLGGVIQAVSSAYGTLSGSNKRIYENELAHQQTMIATKYGTETKLAQQDAEAKQFGQSTRAAVYGGLQPSALTATDRSTYGGEIKYKEEQSRLAGADAQQRAQADLKIATAEKDESAKRLKGLEAGRDDLQQKLAAANDRQTEAAKGSSSHIGRILGSGDALGRIGGEIFDHVKGGADEKESRLKAGQDVLEAAKNFGNLQRQIDAERDRFNKANTDSIQKENALRKTGIDLQKTELGIAQQKGDRLKSQAQRFGDMPEWKKERTYQVIKSTHGRAWNELSPNEKEIRRELNPDKAAADARKIGEQDPRLRELQGLGEKGNEEALPGRIAENQDKQNAIQKSIREAGLAVEAQLATELGQSIGPALKGLVEALEKKWLAEIAEVKAGIQVRNASK